MITYTIMWHKNYFKIDYSFRKEEGPVEKDTFQSDFILWDKEIYQKIGSY